MDGLAMLFQISSLRTGVIALLARFERTFRTIKEPRLLDVFFNGGHCKNLKVKTCCAGTTREVGGPLSTQYSEKH